MSDLDPQAFDVVVRQKRQNISRLNDRIAESNFYDDPDSVIEDLHHKLESEKAELESLIPGSCND